MQSFIRTAIIIAALTGGCPGATARPLAPQAKDSGPPTGSVSGRITVEGTSAANIVVILMSADRNPYQDQPVARSTTDAEGQFQLTRIPAGRFRILALTPTLTPDRGGDSNPWGRDITLTNGESVDGITIPLRRGGVITGRVTDANGRPRIQERITLMLIDENGRLQPLYSSNYASFSTDDRGVYRIYGLSPGRYKVSAGIEPEHNYSRQGVGDTYYSRTFYPGTADEAKANVVEVTAGGEATGIDIPLGRPEKAYAASGRIVDADTGKPVANMIYGYGVLEANRKSVMPMAYGASSDEQGRFRLEGILPGHYVALVRKEDTNGLYGDPAPFQITDADITNIEIKIHHGSSISGILVLDGTDSPEAAAKLSAIRIGAQIRSEQLNTGPSSLTNVNPDGSFRATGFSPGKAYFYITSFPQPREFTLLRVERDGVAQPQGIEVGPGEQITGVKIIVGYGTGKVIGQLKFEGGSLPTGMRLIVMAHRVGGDNFQGNRWQVDADERGRFILEGLLPGEYEISAGTSFTDSGRPSLRLRETKQRVTVSNGAESEVTLVLERETKNN